MVDLKSEPRQAEPGFVVFWVTAQDNIDSLGLETYLSGKGSRVAIFWTILKKSIITVFMAVRKN
jgi:hypothetical protein